MMILFQPTWTAFRHPAKRAEWVSWRRERIRSMVNLQQHLRPAHRRIQNCVELVYVRQAGRVMIGFRFLVAIRSTLLVDIEWLKTRRMHAVAAWHTFRSSRMVQCDRRDQRSICNWHLWWQCQWENNRGSTYCGKVERALGDIVMYGFLLQSKESRSEVPVHLYLIGWRFSQMSNTNKRTRTIITLIIPKHSISSWFWRHWKTWSWVNKYGKNPWDTIVKSRSMYFW